MDKTYVVSKIKKYLFFISITFLVFITSHLAYIYIYNDSKEVAEKGGTISEGVIGSFPHLNPLKKSNDYNDYINHILYRSLLTYSDKKQQIIGDIANCDINNLSKIECFLNENIVWSNGEEITFEDIIATYNILKETSVDPVLKSLLQDIKIEQKESSIVFTNEKKDINTLNIFFQPILPASIIKSLDEESVSGNFSPIDGIYSGKYVIAKVDQDDTLGITRLFLEKNQKYNPNPAYIEKIIFKIFKDSSQFLKHKNTISVFNDKNNLIGDSIPKLETYKYSLPQYIGLFVNTEKIPYVNLRNFILRVIDNNELVSELGEENFKAISSPFLDNLKLETKNQTKNLESMLETLGYYPKERIISLINSGKKENYSDEVKIKEKSEEPSAKENIAKKTNTIEKTFTGSITKQNYLIKSKIIISPDWVDSYNYISKDDLLLKGKVEDGVTSVYINDVALSGFNSGDKEFFYRLKKSYGNIAEGKNEYNIYFETREKKKFIEKITFYYSPSIAKRVEYEDEVVAELNKKEVDAKIKAEKEKNIVKIPDNLKNLEKNNETSKQLEELDPKFYYDKDLKPYTLNLFYVLSSVDNEKTANHVKNKLEELGIKINKISLSIDELRNILIEEKKDYDILITGINSGYFNFNLFPYLHSSQVKSGFNFSNYKKLSLDQILEELKSHNLSKDKVVELEKKILEILKENAVFKTLYTPLYTNLIDKTIEGYTIENILPSSVYRYDPLVTSYVSRKKIINKDGKGVFNFLGFLVNKLIKNGN